MTMVMADTMQNGTALADSASLKEAAKAMVANGDAEDIGMMMKKQGKENGGMGVVEGKKAKEAERRRRRRKQKKKSTRSTSLKTDQSEENGSDNDDAADEVIQCPLLRVRCPTLGFGVRGLIFRMGYGVWLRWTFSRRCNLIYSWCAQGVASRTLVVRRVHHLDLELILYLRVRVTFVWLI